MKMYMFYHWIEDNDEKIELFKHHGLLVGSFMNPEAAKEMAGQGNKISSSDEDFEKSTQMVFDEIKKEREAAPKIKKRRKKLKALEKGN